MPRDQEILRTFICLDLTAAARSSLERIQTHLQRKGLSLSYPHLADAHLTMVFLGDTAAAVIESLIPRLDEVARGFSPFALTLASGGFFGPPRSPRVAWVGVGESAVLMKLQRALADEVRAAGMPLEARPFHPHVTLARIKSRLPADALTLIKSSINNSKFASVPVDCIRFMRSQPGGSGPTYSIIHTSQLNREVPHG